MSTLLAYALRLVTLLILKPEFKIRQSKIALKETPTLKLELTPVMTVNQV